MLFAADYLGPLSIGSNAGSDAALTTTVIPPYRGPAGSAPLLLDGRPASLRLGLGIIHLTTFSYTNGDTAHTLSLVRPKNYTWLTTAIAANGTALVPYDDPGVYSTNYKYPCNLSTGTAKVANNTIATNDWVAFPLVDGTWHKSMIASGTFGGGNLVLTTAVPNVTGGGAAVGAPVYFFGVAADADPATGDASMNNSVAAVATSGVGFKVWQDLSGVGFYCSLHPGDPLMVFDPGTTHLGTIEYISGYYARS